MLITILIISTANHVLKLGIIASSFKNKQSHSNILFSLRSAIATIAAGKNTSTLIEIIINVVISEIYSDVDSKLLNELHLLGAHVTLLSQTITPNLISVFRVIDTNIFTGCSWVIYMSSTVVFFRDLDFNLLLDQNNDNGVISLNLEEAGCQYDILTMNRHGLQALVTMASTTTISYSSTSMSMISQLKTYYNACILINETYIDVQSLPAETCIQAEYLVTNDNIHHSISFNNDNVFLPIMSKRCEIFVDLKVISSVTNFVKHYELALSNDRMYCERLISNIWIDLLIEPSNVIIIRNNNNNLKNMIIY